ncbi:MAG: signal peptidase I [Spirochaetales bacterium]|nr:MAG: signal peptidase I [Spirochaetales bacterium]
MNKSGPETGKQHGKKARFWTRIAAALAAALVCFYCITSVAVDIVNVRGTSMEPAIADGSLLLVNKLAYGLRLPWSEKYTVSWKKPKKGDIVLFRHSGSVVVKRCIEFYSTLVMVAGDNGSISMDSAFYGAVSIDSILGRVIKAHG